MGGRRGWYALLHSIVRRTECIVRRRAYSQAREGRGRRITGGVGTDGEGQWGAGELELPGASPPFHHPPLSHRFPQVVVRYGRRGRHPSTRRAGESIGAETRWPRRLSGPPKGGARMGQGGARNPLTKSMGVSPGRTTWSPARERPLARAHSGSEVAWSGGPLEVVFHHPVHPCGFPPLVNFSSVRKSKNLSRRLWPRRFWPPCLSTRRASTSCGSYAWAAG